MASSSTARAAPRAARPPLEVAVDLADLTAVREALATHAPVNAALACEYAMSEFAVEVEKSDKLLSGTVLHLAVLRRHEGVVRALLDAGADAEASGTVALYHGFDWDGGFVREDWSPETLANNLDYVEVALCIGQHLHNSGGAKDAARVAESSERKHKRRRKKELADGKAKRRRKRRAAADGPSEPEGAKHEGEGDGDDGECECDVSSVVYNPSAARAKAPSPVGGAAAAAPHRWRDIDPSEITLEEAFDSGGFGVVYHAQYAGQAVAVKLMPLPVSLVEDAQLRKVFLKELEALSAANERSDRVCKLFGASVIGGRLCLVMKLYAGCLHDVIDDAPGHRMRTVDIVPALHDIALGLRDMHAEGIVLRDLKPANCLIDVDLQRVVLADFGLARRVRDSHAGRLGTTTNIAGTPNYSAPECFGDDHLTSAVDIWSWAACAVHMFTGEPPYAALTIFQIATKVAVKREHPAIPERAPELLKALLGRCFSHDPAARPTAPALVAALEEVIATGGY